MDDGTDYSRPHVPVPFSRRMFDYFRRATFWFCPICGTQPLFPPLSRIRGLQDWFTPLDGCPHCGYAYDREPGYFLWAVWALGYIVSAVVGIAIYVYLQIWHSDWSFLATLLWVAVPLPFINVLFARHAKAYFLAADHLADPHVRPDQDEGGSDGGGPPLQPQPTPLDAPLGKGPTGQPTEADTEAFGARK